MIAMGEDYKLEFLSIDLHRLVFNYVVIVSVYSNKLVWVRQKGKLTWEIPGGHVEPGELVDSAASRELVEETGAIRFEVFPLCDFRLVTDNAVSYNRLYFAEIFELSNDLCYETEEVAFSNEIPFPLTHGSIQPRLIGEARKIMKIL